MGDDKLEDKEESKEGSLGKEKEEVIGGFEVEVVVDEALRGMRGKGAPALLAL
jgi:hypothetical protein